MEIEEYQNYEKVKRVFVNYYINDSTSSQQALAALNEAKNCLQKLEQAGLGYKINQLEMKMGLMQAYLNAIHSIDKDNNTVLNICEHLLESTKKADVRSFVPLLL
jgi:hypothetical protein